MRNTRPMAISPLKITRRSLLVSALALPLAGCLDSEVVTIRFRVIATVEFKGQQYDASTVMECSYWRVKHSLTGRGGGSNLVGEALIFDLPENAGTFFLLPYFRSSDGGFMEIYQDGVLATFGIHRGVGSLTDEDFEKMKSFSGQKRFNFFEHLPQFIAFKDEANPKTIFDFDPWKMNEVFPDARFIRLNVEITDDAITERLSERLPWLSTPRDQPLFGGTPPGDDRAMNELPLVNVMTRNNFFAQGSW